MTALHAAARGHDDVMHRLLDAGATVDAVDVENGFTPLLTAAGPGSTGAVAALLAAAARTTEAGRQRTPQPFSCMTAMATPSNCSPSTEFK